MATIIEYPSSFGSLAPTISATPVSNKSVSTGTRSFPLLLEEERFQELRRWEDGYFDDVIVHQVIAKCLLQLQLGKRKRTGACKTKRQRSCPMPCLPKLLCKLQA